MRDEEIGLQFFTKDPLPVSGRPSIFSHVDQEDLFDRFDDVAEDDLASPFFADSLADVENAATRAFTIGVRILASETAPPPRAFGAEEAVEQPVDHVVATNAPAARGIARTPMSVEGRLGRDRSARRAFILGGPRAVEALMHEGG